MSQGSQKQQESSASPPAKDCTVDSKVIGPSHGDNRLRRWTFCCKEGTQTSVKELLKRHPHDNLGNFQVGTLSKRVVEAGVEPIRRGVVLTCDPAVNS